MLTVVILIILFPLAGAAVNGLFGWRLREASGYIGAAAVGLSWILSLRVLFWVMGGGELNEDVYAWIAAGSFKASVGFQVDALSTIMIVTVTTISFLIHVYSFGYMRNDPGFARFFAYLNLFVFSMLVLVLANNYLLMFVGWEGVGLCSYLLIGFWYERKSASDAGKKAFIVNRIGDFGFLLGIFLMASYLGTVQYAEVFEKAPLMLSTGVATAIALLLFLGACGKSAQFPLYVWLPDAMEGPTPVSSLIHAATMVTAGVYMVARSNVLYTLAPTAGTVVAWVGVATALLAATIALVNTDIKRVLAYSTVSQLGYMFIGVGVGAYTAGIFHLFTHAFFKGLMFLAAGSVMHAMQDEQDMRKMGAAGQDADNRRYVLDRRARHRGNSAACRLLEQGRNPGERLPLRKHGNLGSGRPGCGPYRVLHVPADPDDFSWTTPGSAPVRPRSRVAGEHDRPAGVSGAGIGSRGLRGRAAGAGLDRCVPERNGRRGPP